MKNVSISFLLLLLLAQNIWAQTTQTVRGQIVDGDSEFPIIGATVLVVGTDPIIGAATDVNGYFILKNVPVGRISLKISAVGYEELSSNNLVVVSGKELQVNYSMQESITSLDEIVIVAHDDPTEVNNDMVTVSARSFDMEQTSRFAGSRNDPARMATNFAGVSGANDARNDIIVRGNSPSGVLWRLEGIDIPSPNHFASFGSTGGPVSMLNYNTLARSDFMTAAFPAEYGNALAGVFDLQMRNGNNGRHEFLYQIGFNGFELGAEGPLKKGSNASYLVNYRYSTLGVFETLGFDLGTGTAVPQYQDLSFKVNIPTKNAGRFVIWGLGGVSDIELLGSELDLENNTDLFGNENEDIYNGSNTGILGFSHTYFFNKNTFYKLSVAATHQFESTEIDSVSLIDRNIQTRYISVNNRQNKLSAHIMVNRKLDKRNTMTAGWITDIQQINFADSVLLQTGWFIDYEGEGTNILSRGYVNWQHRFNENLTLNSGAHVMHFSLNNQWQPEIRVGLKQALNTRQSISLGYGLHHQLQLLPTYYTTTQLADGSIAFLNKDMDFTRSHHVVLGYDHLVFSDFRIKAEVYYQQLSNAPVERFPSSFSMLNAGAEFAVPDEDNLVSEGSGRNYGLEITAEKFFGKQYYFLATASIFESEYQGSDDVWRNTAFNGNYVVNLLGGKEWNIGGKQNTLAIDGKVTAAGGRYYTPVDLAQSAVEGQPVFDNIRAFSQQFDDYFRADLKIMYRMNRKKATHEMGIDIQNITNRDNVFRQSYNERTNTVSTEYQLGIFPVPQYRILF